MYPSIAFPTKSSLYLRRYDGLSRLIEADYDNGTTVKTYSYDLAGNMTNMNGTTRTYNAANQMTNDGTNTLTYDANGNLTNDGTNAYTWDRANRLLSHGGLSYAYDGVGNRVSQDNGSVVTKYLLDTQPGLAVVLRESDGTNTNHYVHGLRGIRAQYDGSAWEYMMQDGLGSVRGMIDSVGAVQQSINYSEYGDPDTSMTGFAFTGEQRDTNGLQYHRARFYDPTLGIWINQDKIEFPNRYWYASQNPINRVDPNGLQDIDVAPIAPPPPTTAPPTIAPPPTFTPAPPITDTPVPPAPTPDITGTSEPEECDAFCRFLLWLCSITGCTFGKGGIIEKVRPIEPEENCGCGDNPEPSITDTTHFTSKQNILCYLNCYNGGEFVQQMGRIDARASTIHRIPPITEIPIRFHTDISLSAGSFDPARRRITLLQPGTYRSGVAVGTKSRGDVLASLVEEIAHAGQFYSIPPSSPCESIKEDVIEQERDAKLLKLRWINLALTHPEVSSSAFEGTAEYTRGLEFVLNQYRERQTRGNLPNPFRDIGCPAAPSNTDIGCIDPLVFTHL